ncbi:MAG: carbamoyl-phosphate synthase large subunit [Defluviitaleaceae bacterium]|nr:carbamoyl-phosphate synthase large subunit [Defluviitaleaceae bacterium]
MPNIDSIKKIMIIGSGPIVIGQACEFDYSGTQACKALKNLGYEVVLVNSNPATIMTDPDTADITYIEPLNPNRLKEIIKKERPCALLPNLGGQSGLNLSLELEKMGILKEYGVKVIGINVDAIERGEDRIIFKETMDKIGVEMAASEPAYTVDEAVAIADKLSYPIVIRPAYTMGGAGGGICQNEEELRNTAEKGIAASMIGQILVEESLLGWQELEVEVIRDKTGHKIVACFIENVDPMGIHTGDSFCVAPYMNISKELEDRLKDISFRIAEEVEIIGGSNVQLAYNPKTDRIVVIEINPRTSRSSALASKATGFPIAYVSALLAVGLTLEEIPWCGGNNLSEYTPSDDYVVVKFPRFAFDKFKDAEDQLGTQMKAVGEVMAIGKNFNEAFLKAIRSLEARRWGLGLVDDFCDKSKEELLQLADGFTSERQFIIYEAMKKGATVDEVNAITHINKNFLEQVYKLVKIEKELVDYGFDNVPKDVFLNAKQNGFSDMYMAKLWGKRENDVIKKRLDDFEIKQKWQGIPVSGISYDSSYYFSSYNLTEDISVEESNKKVLILGSGPNRIGQGVEFDYCCVHAAFALREMGFTTIMVNCNPETVSTDYDTSDRLYFEPLTIEDVLSIYEKEKPLGVITQFGGQTPLNIAKKLEEYGVKILGTSTKSIIHAEDRDLFAQTMQKLDIPMPESGMAINVAEAKEVAAKIGYPVMVRPSYVLGGAGMKIVNSDEEMAVYMKAAVNVTPDTPILIDRFLSSAIECEADALYDGESGFLPAVMEHIEYAGIHSGDSACVVPSISISEENLEIIKDYTIKIAKELNVCGLINVQYAIDNGKVYVLEANPRASRSVPIVSKVCNVQMARLATQVIMAEHVDDSDKILMKDIKEKKVPYFGVKEAVLPFVKFPEVDPVLGPEMKSTGEVLGLSDSLGIAFLKAQEAVKANFPEKGNVLISLNRLDRTQEMAKVAEALSNAGFYIFATKGTWNYLREYGIKEDKGERINKAFQTDDTRFPNVIDKLDKREIHLVINTPLGAQSEWDDSYIRKACVKLEIPYLTTAASAKAAANGLSELKNTSVSGVKSLQEYHKTIK